MMALHVWIAAGLLLHGGVAAAEDVVVDKLYNETYRPQFHFSPKKNWTNDPNGLVFYKGEYHLFFQHNPTGINWGNMHWGHAISPDLVHWEELPIAIEPDEHGPVFSGSAVVDWNNTSGLKSGDEKVLAAFYTGAGEPSVQCLAYSNDRGRTWRKYPGNPVVKNLEPGNRDPKVVWHAPSSKWVMALYLKDNDFAFFSSSNLKDWTQLGAITVPGSAECPDLFELPVDGDAKNTKWIFLGGDGNYLIGAFDGKAFHKEVEKQRGDWGKNFYATQTYSDIPADDGRRIQIAWMNGGKYPEMPFNQQMTFPCELTLRTFPEGVRMCRQPVKEIAGIHDKTHEWHDVPLAPDTDPLAGVTGDLFDIRAEIEPGAASELGFIVRGEPVKYDAAKKELSCLGAAAALTPDGDKIKVQILVDRTSIEIYGNDGKISMSSCFLPKPSDKSLTAYAKGGAARIVSLTVFELRSTWPKPPEGRRP